MYTRAASRCARLISRPYATRLSKVHAYTLYDPGTVATRRELIEGLNTGLSRPVRLTQEGRAALFPRSEFTIIRHANYIAACINKHSGNLSRLIGNNLLCNRIQIWLSGCYQNPEYSPTRILPIKQCVCSYPKECAEGGGEGARDYYSSQIFKPMRHNTRCNR